MTNELTRAETTPEQGQIPAVAAVATGSGIRLRTAYRTLNYLEEIRDGDEVDSCRDPMRDPPRWTPATNIGDFAPDPAYPAHRIYRRPLRQNVQSEPRDQNQSNT